MSMGVYIKGMEMPKKYPVTVTIFPDGISAVKTISSRRFTATAVPVPPHGRLIDADKMRESIKMQSSSIKLMGGDLAKIAETLEKGVLQEIANAPTIIPAEEEKS